MKEKKGEKQTQKNKKLKRERDVNKETNENILFSVRMVK
jgi:hypothetical protein